MIGSHRRRILSGGERKRIAIGLEMITDPDLILLDEPTSGLDSFNALKIIKILKAFALKGKTVISTLHSPSSQAFSLIDRLYLLIDGNLVY